MRAGRWARRDDSQGLMVSLSFQEGAGNTGDQGKAMEQRDVRGNCTWARYYTWDNSGEIRVMWQEVMSWWLSGVSLWCSRNWQVTPMNAHRQREGAGEREKGGMGQEKTTGNENKWHHTHPGTTNWFPFLKINIFIAKTVISAPVVCTETNQMMHLNLHASILFLEHQ